MTAAMTHSDQSVSDSLMTILDAARRYVRIYRIAMASRTVPAREIRLPSLFISEVSGYKET